MGLDYALVHIKYTISPAILLSLLYRPLFTHRDGYRILFLITIAVTATIPWDSYLIRSRIWSYPPHAVLGPTIFAIPAEELFFFVIQTYDVSLLYLLLTKATFYPIFLPRANSSSTKSTFSRSVNPVLGIAGQFFLLLATVSGAYLVQHGGTGTYMGLILVWAFPFLFLLWTLSHSFMLRIPVVNIVLPIAIPTVYLWIVDTFSLKRGTWVIENGTKCGIELWDGLELEEAVFFLVTNTLIVFGQLAFENAVSIIDAFPKLFPHTSSCPSPATAVRALLTPHELYDTARLSALSQAIERLQQKSRSFYLASSAFEGRLRIDLVLLYSFCRLADDLVDAAPIQEDAQDNIHRLRKFLDKAYVNPSPESTSPELRHYIKANFGIDGALALLYLPVSYLSPEPLYSLLDGFETDLKFASKGDFDSTRSWPIHNVEDLNQYGKCVAGTVAELCLDLVFHHHGYGVSPDTKSRLKASAVDMGIALQTVNISRDIIVDAELNRVYIPGDWLKFEKISPEHIIRDPSTPAIGRLRSRLLDKAFEQYKLARPAIEELPRHARGPMRVAIESYMEIGRVLRDETYQVRAGRATVPIIRRLLVAWKTLNE